MIRSKLFFPLFLILLVSCADKQAPTGDAPVKTRWEAGAQAGKLDLLAVDLLANGQGWAVGDIDPAPPTTGSVLYTADGGRSWQKIAEKTEIFEAVHFVSATRGWIAGYAGRIERTDDGGRTWKIQRVEREGEVLNSLFFLDQDRGWVVGGGGIIFRTLNGGDRWEPVPTGRVEDFWDVRFSSPDRGWIVGEDGLVLATTDGGATWTAQASGTERALFCLALASQTAVIAVGEAGTIIRSGDGSSWAAMDSKTTESLNAVAAASPEVLWAVGSKGATVGSTDGGATWTHISAVTGRDLISVDFSDLARGVAVGQRGAIQLLIKDNR